jgi:hypothetical protein
VAIFLAGSLSIATAHRTFAADSGLPVQGRAGGQVSRDQSKLLVAEPGLPTAQEFYQHHILGPDGNVSYYTVVWPQRGADPRMQARYDIAGTGKAYAGHPDMDAEWVRRLMPFFNAKVIAVRSIGEVPDVHHAKTIRFSVDRSDCVGFHYLTGDDGAKPLAKAPRIVYGYAYSAECAQINDFDIERALHGITLHS